MSYEVGTLEPNRPFQRTTYAIFWASYVWDRYAYVPWSPFWGA